MQTLLTKSKLTMFLPFVVLALQAMSGAPGIHLVIWMFINCGLLTLNYFLCHVFPRSKITLFLIAGSVITQAASAPTAIEYFQVRVFVFLGASLVILLINRKLCEMEHHQQPQN